MGGHACIMALTTGRRPVYTRAGRLSTKRAHRENLVRKEIAMLTLLAVAAPNGCGRTDTTRLWYKSPARNWVEALPVGNSNLGAMVFGGVREERIQLNEKSMWSGSPQDADNPEAKAALPEIRKLLFEGKYAEAERLSSEKLI